MTHEEAVNDLNAIKEFFEQKSGAYPVSLEYAINALKSGTKVVAQITFDEEKLCEIVKEAVERFKEEYEIADRPQGEWIDVNGNGSLWRCDQCKDTACCKGNFCSNCGARMKGADDDR